MRQLPRKKKIRIIQCSLAGAWYESIELEDFTVIDSFDQYYVVHTWNPIYGMIPSLILKLDCRVIH